MNRWITAVVFMVSFSFLGQASAMTSTVKSFETWKSEKIAQAQEQVKATKQQLILQGQRQADKNRDQTLRSLYSQLNQDEWNLEVTKDLAVTDYIALYLSQQTSETRHLEAAGRLTIQEVAEVIEAYSRAIGVLQNDKPAAPTLRSAGQSD